MTDIGHFTPETKPFTYKVDESALADYRRRQELRDRVPLAERVKVLDEVLAARERRVVAARAALEVVERIQAAGMDATARVLVNDLAERVGEDLSRVSHDFDADLEALGETLPPKKGGGA